MTRFTKVGLFGCVMGVYAAFAGIPVSYVITALVFTFAGMIWGMVAGFDEIESRQRETDRRREMK